MPPPHHMFQGEPQTRRTDDDVETRFDGDVCFFVSTQDVGITADALAEEVRVVSQNTPHSDRPGALNSCVV